MEKLIYHKKVMLVWFSRSVDDCMETDLNDLASIMREKSDIFTRGSSYNKLINRDQMKNKTHTCMKTSMNHNNIIKMPIDS